MSKCSSMLRFVDCIVHAPRSKPFDNHQSSEISLQIGKRSMSSCTRRVVSECWFSVTCADTMCAVMIGKKKDV
jgi:hypothetical protein